MYFACRYCYACARNFSFSYENSYIKKVCPFIGMQIFALSFGFHKFKECQQFIFSIVIHIANWIRARYSLEFVRVSLNLWTFNIFKFDYNFNKLKFLNFVFNKEIINWNWVRHLLRLVHYTIYETIQVLQIFGTASKKLKNY